MKNDGEYRLDEQEMLMSFINALQRKNERLGESIFAADVNGDILYVNERFAHECRLQPHTHKYSLFDFVEGMNHERWMRFVTDIRQVKTQYIEQREFIKPDSQRIFANAFICHDRPEGQPEVIWFFAYDITQQVIQQAEINRLQTLVEAILNTIPVFLWVKEPENDFKYLYWNKAFEKHTGIPAEVAIGKNDYELFGNKKLKDKKIKEKKLEVINRFRREDKEVLESGYLQTEERSILDKGEQVISTTKMKISTGNDNALILGVAWDITQLKNAEKKLIEAKLKAEQADMLKSAFLANMSHEIRTPLNAIVGFSSLAMEAQDQDEKTMYADIVEKNCKLLLQLFTDIIDLSLIESGSMNFAYTPTSLYDICLCEYKKLKSQTQYQVKLILDNQPDSAVVTTDPVRLSQVLNNLLINSLKFTNEGEIHFGYSVKGDFVEFYVEDTGIGIPENKLSTIFNRFSKVDNFAQGTGLGLALSRMLVQKLGGEMQVTSIENVKTRFTFTVKNEEEDGG